MIVIDSSVLIAILFDEPEKPAFPAVITSGERCLISAMNVHKTASVLRIRHGRQAVERRWQLLADNNFEIVPFDEAQVRTAAATSTASARVLIPRRSSIQGIAPPTRSPRR